MLALTLQALSWSACAGWGGAVLAPPAMMRPRAQAVAMQMATIDLEAPTPVGPDPYKMVGDDLDFIKRSIKKLLTSKKGDSAALTSNGVLTMAAREFMDRKGKSFRPMLVLLIGRATSTDFTTGPLHSKLSVISEMIHTASLIHSDVLEEYETDTSMGTLVHQEVALEVGNKVCILAGDFLLAKAAVELSLLENSDVTEIVAQGLEAICEGGMQTFNSQTDYESLETLTLELHLEAVGASVAELVGNSCQCAAILSGHEAKSTMARACHLYGYELAMARELIKEADELDAALRKSRRNPKKLRALLPAFVRTPILKTAETYPEAHQLLTGEPPAKVATMLEQAKAVQVTRELAAKHAQSAADALNVLPNSATRDALLILCHKVVTGSPIK